MGDLLSGANRFSALFEMVPIGLALVVLLICWGPLPSSRRTNDKVILRLSGLCALLLLAAQSSWWVTYIWHGKLADTVGANAIWTLFNSLVMIVLILVARAGAKNG